MTKKYPALKILLLLLICFMVCFGEPQKILADESDAIESFSVSASENGFRPGSGNYLRIRTYVDTSSQKALIRLRIYDNKGRYVFEKKYKNSVGGYIDYKWKGKPSKKNEAGASAKKYLKKGRYTAEACVFFDGEETFSDQRLCEFKIISQTSPGKKDPLAVTVPVLTGNAKVDYMAEQILKSAKVKASQSDTEKVRRIYHWMTVHQKHVHYYEGGSFKKYYKLSSSGKKIRKYKKSADALCEKGALIYNHDYELIRRSWCMERRIGVCTDHAAIFKILCNHAGIDAGICSGYYLNRNGTKAQHSWNYAVVDGKTYYYDVDVEIQNYGKGQGDYYWYQKTKAEAKLTHQFVTTTP